MNSIVYKSGLFPFLEIYNFLFFFLPSSFPFLIPYFLVFFSVWKYYFAQWLIYFIRLPSLLKIMNRFSLVRLKLCLSLLGMEASSQASQ